MQPFEIHVPEEKRLPGSEDPKYAGLLLDRLSLSARSEVLIELSSGMVLCGEKPIAELLTMLLRAKKFDQLLKELDQLLFAPVELGSKGILSCERNGQAQRFSVTQLKPMPGLKLRIRRVT